MPSIIGNSTEPKGNKQKRSSVTINQRLEILDRLKKGEKGSKIATELGLSSSTVSMIKRNEDEIMRRKILESCEGNFNSKRFRKTEESKLDSAVYNWFRDTRETGAPVTGLVLKTVALNTHQEIEGTSNFKASNGWLRGFTGRHHIRWVKLHGEKVSGDHNASENFKRSFAAFREVNEFNNLDVIYNCDETGLNWKYLPDRSFVGEEEKNVSGRKQSKNRLTVMNCTNASGTHKLPLFVIGKSKHPRCFKNQSNFPVRYASQDSAWMDREIFFDWFTTCFIPSVKEHHDYENNNNLRIILLMDNARVHPPIDELHKLCDFCTVIYLPPNTTALIQPMDQGIIEKFKRIYKHMLLTHVLIKKKTMGFEDAMQSVQLTDCFIFCDRAWQQITKENVRNCWKKLIPMTDDQQDESEVMEISDSSSVQQLLSMIYDSTNISVEQVNQWLDNDKFQQCWDVSNNPDDVNDVLAPSEPYQEELEQNTSQENHSSVSLMEVHGSIENIMQWIETCEVKSFSSLRENLNELNT